MSYTLTEAGKVMNETQEGITMPADYSFSTVNDYVHGMDVNYEDLECLCLGMADHIDKLTATPSIEAAYEMGTKGGPVVEAERIAFESYMRGHCWIVSDTWNGKQYDDRAEYRDVCEIDPIAMDTRRLWAVWRDRAALANEALK